MSYEQAAQAAEGRNNWTWYNPWSGGDPDMDMAAIRGEVEQMKQGFDRMDGKNYVAQQGMAEAQGSGGTDITGPRFPDFYSLNVTLAIPNPLTGTILGWSGSVSIDRHGQIFTSPIGAAVGKSAFAGSASLTANYLLQSNKPTASETYNFLSGHGISIGGGYIAGANWTISPTNSGSNNALGFGLYTPQIGASYNYTPGNFVFFKK